MRIDDVAMGCQVERILRHYDPIAVAWLETYEPVYQLEAESIAAHICEARSASEMCRIVQAEFALAYGETMAGPEEFYVTISEEIWRLANQQRSAQLADEKPRLPEPSLGAPAPPLQSRTPRRHGNTRSSSSHHSPLRSEPPSSSPSAVN
jgi:hypothetical protein